MTVDHVTFFLLPFLRCDVVVLGCVVLICFVELSFIFVIYILLLKKSGCVAFLECSAPSCDRNLPEKFRPDPSTFYLVIVVTDKQTDKRTPVIP